MRKILCTCTSLIIILCYIPYLLIEAKQNMVRTFSRDAIKRNIFKFHPFLRKIKLSENMKSLYAKHERVIKREVEELKGHPGRYKIGNSLYDIIDGQLVPVSPVPSGRRMLETKNIIVKTLNIYPNYGSTLSQRTTESSTTTINSATEYVGTIHKGLIVGNNLILSLVPSVTQNPTLKNVEVSNHRAVPREDNVNGIEKMSNEYNENVINRLGMYVSSTEVEMSSGKEINEHRPEKVKKQVKLHERKDDVLTTSDSDNVKEQEIWLMKMLLNNSENTEKHTFQKEGFPCNIIGSWISQASGKQIEVENENNVVEFKCSNRQPISDLRQGFMSKGNWTMHGTLLFKNSDVIAMTAVNKRDQLVASFIGQCRVCDGCDTVSGEWLLKHLARDCRDREASQQVLGDIWRRNNLNILQKILNKNNS